MTLGQSAGVTDAGRRRRRNEDAYVCEPPLFAVADGMGGAQAGEIASRLAAAALSSGPGSSGSGEERVAALIQEANRRIYERSSEDEAVSGMGTTMTVALAEDDTVAIGHVGDSRAYLIRDRSLEQLTEDHSLVAELVRSGKLSPEEAEVHPQRSVITRALGTDPDVDVDTFLLPARAGDVFMLCSDGLTSMVDDEAILSIIERNQGNLRTAAKELVSEANKGGGEDNITIVLFEIAEAEDTVQMPAAAAETARDPSDEDTLSGLEPVPVVEVAEQDGRARARGRRRRFSRRVLLVVVLLIAAALAALLVFGLSRAHFVGAEPNGHVAVYQGVPWNITGGVRLYRLVYESPSLLAGELSRPERKRLFDHHLLRYRTALSRVKTYEREVFPP
jgi:serine/threonine protein phosphatase PrpC